MWNSSWNPVSFSKHSLLSLLICNRKEGSGGGDNHGALGFKYSSPDLQGKMSREQFDYLGLTRDIGRRDLNLEVLILQLKPRELWELLRKRPWNPSLGNGSWVQERDLGVRCLELRSRNEGSLEHCPEFIHLEFGSAWSDGSWNRPNAKC